VLFHAVDHGRDVGTLHEAEGRMGPPEVRRQFLDAQALVPVDPGRGRGGDGQHDETFKALEQRRSSEELDTGLAFDRAGDHVDLIGGTVTEATIMDASIDDDRLAELPRSAEPPRVRVRKRPLSRGAWARSPNTI